MEEKPDKYKSRNTGNKIRNRSIKQLLYCKYII